MNKAIAVFSNSKDSHIVKHFTSIRKAAAYYKVSNYTVINAVFTGKPLPDGTCFDLENSVTRRQERELYKAWLYCRKSGGVRKYGKPKKEL